jgi:hypothetical protein
VDCAGCLLIRTHTVVREFLSSPDKEDFVCHPEGDIIGTEVAEMYRFVFECMNDERPAGQRPFSSTMQSCMWRKRPNEARCAPVRGSGALLDALDLLTVCGTFPQPAPSGRVENNPGRKEGGSYAPLDELWENALLGKKQDLKPDEHHPRLLFDRIWKSHLLQLPEGQPPNPFLMDALVAGLLVSRQDIQDEIGRMRLKVQKKREEGALTATQKASGHASAVKELVQQKSASGKSCVADLQLHLVFLGMKKSAVVALGNLPNLVQELLIRLSPSDRAAVDKRAEVIQQEEKQRKQRKKQKKNNGSSKRKGVGAPARPAKQRRRQEPQWDPEEEERTEEEEEEEEEGTEEEEEQGEEKEKVEDEAKEGSYKDNGGTVAIVTFFEAHKTSWKKIEAFAAVVAKSRPLSDPLHQFPAGSSNKAAGAYAIEQARIPRVDLDAFLRGGKHWVASKGVRHMQRLWKVCSGQTELTHDTLHVGDRVIISDEICSGWGVCTAVALNPTTGKDGWQFKLKRSDSCNEVIASVASECSTFGGWSWNCAADWLVLKKFHVVPWDDALEETQSFE